MNTNKEIEIESKMSKTPQNYIYDVEENTSVSRINFHVSKDGEINLKYEGKLDDSGYSAITQLLDNQRSFATQKFNVEVKQSKGVDFFIIFFSSTLLSCLIFLTWSIVSALKNNTESKTTTTTTTITSPEKTQQSPLLVPTNQPSPIN